MLHIDYILWWSQVARGKSCILWMYSWFIKWKIVVLFGDRLVKVCLRITSSLFSKVTILIKLIMLLMMFYYIYIDWAPMLFIVFLILKYITNLLLFVYYLGYIGISINLYVLYRIILFRLPVLFEGGRHLFYSLLFLIFYFLSSILPFELFSLYVKSLSVRIR